MRNTTLSTLLAALAIVATTAVYTACDDGSSAVKEPPPGTGGAIDGGLPDGSGTDAGTLPDGAPRDCFENPKTHFEIINACTNATRITKDPTLPKLLPDGGLPPLD